MEDMTYITQSDISLDDVAACLKNAGYKAFSKEFGGGEALLVYYPIQYRGEVVEDYCRWLSGGEIQKVGFEDAQIRRFHRKDPQLKYALGVMYGGTLHFSALAQMFKVILERYGGYAYVEGLFFDQENIEEMQNVTYGHFSEDDETDI